MILLMMAGLQGGCYHYVPVQVTCVDDRSGKPLAGVSMFVYYHNYLAFDVPKATRGTTDVNGTTNLSICSDYSETATLYFDYMIYEPAVMDGWSGFALPVKNYEKLREEARLAGQPMSPIPLTVRLVPSAYVRATQNTSGDGSK
jgi:hypothetical protein